VSDEPAAVLIVGGGIVGLSAALFLERVGVRAMLVERHPTTSIHPRARGVNGRSMELLRELGLEHAVRAAGGKLAPAVGIYRGETLRGVLEARGQGSALMRRLRANAGRGRPTKSSPVSPCRCPQDELEPLLLTAARERGVDARLFTELTELQQDAHGVTCRLLDRASGVAREVRARYVIAADGARSRTRERLGIARSVEVRGGHQMNLLFRADLRSLVAGREFSLCLIEQPGLLGLFTSIDNADQWVLHVAYAPDRGERPEDFTKERCVELIRRAAGIPELAVELKGALPWESSTRIADRYREGRVFLAGDAAHIMPPWGGFGANTGIQDAHNLAWKLAAVLQGRAGDRLLDSYELERRPIALELGAISASMNGARGLIAVGTSPLRTLWNVRRVFRYLGVGYGYGSPLVSLERGRTPGPRFGELDGRPGTRAPHVWLTTREGAEPRSSLDWLGKGYVLWLGSGAEAWAEAAQLMAAEGRDPVTCVQLGRDAIDARGRAARAFGVGRGGASLVRPDGFVAWRARNPPPSAAVGARLLREVLDRALGRLDLARAS
jgi:putative polyketide hydroxylase